MLVLASPVLGVFSFGVLGVLPLVPRYGPTPLQTWVAAVTFAYLGITAVVAPYAAFRNRKIASLLYLIAAPFAALGVWFSRVELTLIVHPANPQVGDPTAISVAMVFVPLILFGYFWSTAHRYRWPEIATATGLPLWVSAVTGFAAGFLFFACVCATSVHIASLWELPGDCGGPPSFSKPYPGHAVFIARVVHIDSVIGAMAIVQQRFGGLPWWSKVVFLKFVRSKGSWFVDGRLEEGLVTNWVVPVLDLKCSGSAPFRDAGVELRLFRDGRRWNGVRIIGRVVAPPGARKGRMPVNGTAVIIEGPMGSIATVTDNDGIYDISGLPPGSYSIRLQSSGPHGICQDFRQHGLEAGDVWGCELSDW